MKLLSVIIVSWNVEDCIKGCIDSLNKYTDIPYEIIIVDNKSSDNSVSIIKSIRDDRIILVENDENVGFSQANNIGLKLAKGDYILFLNPDIIFIDDVITPMIACLNENGGIGVVTPVITNLDGTLQLFYEHFPKNGFQIFLGEMGFGRLFQRIYSKKNDYEKRIGNRFVDWTIGAVQMVRKSDISAIGGYPDDYHMYCEDMDLCMSMKTKLDKRTWVIDRRIIHLGGNSEKKQDSDYKIRNLAKSMGIFLKKYYEEKQVKEYLKVLIVSFKIKYVVCCITGSMKKDTYIKYVNEYKEIFEKERCF